MLLTADHTVTHRQKHVHTRIVLLVFGQLRFGVSNRFVQSRQFIFERLSEGVTYEVRQKIEKKKHGTKQTNKQTDTGNITNLLSTLTHSAAATAAQQHLTHVVLTVERLIEQRFERCDGAVRQTSAQNALPFARAQTLCTTPNQTAQKYKC